MTSVFLLSKRRQTFNSNSITWLALQPALDHVAWPWTADCVTQQQRLPGQGAACSLCGEVGAGRGWGAGRGPCGRSHPARGLPSTAKPVSCSALSPTCLAEDGQTRRTTSEGEKATGKWGPVQHHTIPDPQEHFLLCVLSARSHLKY